MTSNDRHASHDSPYRTGQHVPLAQNKNAPFTPGVTSAMDSRADLNSPYDHDLEAGHSFSRTNSSPHLSQGPGSLQRTGSNLDAIDSGEIQMQNFSDGLPPPPPVAHSWRRMDRWLEDNYEELWENLCEPATFNDVNELELELDCTLPQEVRESLQIHDGQERGGMPTGVIFGCMLLDCEEIYQEWQNWRTVNEAYFSDASARMYDIPQAPTKAFAGSSSSAVPVAQAQASVNPHWRQDLIDKQDSQPTNAIQKAYAHPAWIPMARDWGGNNIAIDLAPGPTGKWGQVILMGRDYDCKFVISRSWSAFLATVADDMNTDKWFIDEETKELKLREFKQPGVEPAYIDILRWRSDQKYGRKGPKKRSGQPLKINSQVAGATQANGYSPYGSPTSQTEDRGRSPQRFTSNGKGPATSSPRAHVSSPLARVTEETASSPQSQKAPTQESSIDATMASPPVADKLISLDSPVVPAPAATEIPETNSEDKPKASNLQNNSVTADHEEEVIQKVAASTISETTKAGAADDGEMKNVEI